MEKDDEEKVEKLSDRLIELMEKLHDARLTLTKIEEEATELLRKLFRIDG